MAGAQVSDQEMVDPETADPGAGDPETADRGAVGVGSAPDLDVDPDARGIPQRGRRRQRKSVHMLDFGQTWLVAPKCEQFRDTQCSALTGAEARHTFESNYDTVRRGTVYGQRSTQYLPFPPSSSSRWTRGHPTLMIPVT